MHMYELIVYNAKCFYHSTRAMKKPVILCVQYKLYNTC